MALLDRLVQAAKAVREHAHAPYSRYKVGAAIATKSGSIFVGCNVENASLGATICAERGAIMQMIAHGERDPIACAVVTGDAGASPCGICRQVLAEFATDMPVVLVGLGSREGETGELELDEGIPGLRGPGSNGTESRIQASCDTNAGFLSGRSSPRAIRSGSEKA